MPIKPKLYPIMCKSATQWIKGLIRKEIDFRTRP